MEYETENDDPLTLILTIIALAILLGIILIHNGVLFKDVPDPPERIVLKEGFLNMKSKEMVIIDDEIFELPDDKEWADKYHLRIGDRYRLVETGDLYSLETTKVERQTERPLTLQHEMKNK